MRYTGTLSMIVAATLAFGAQAQSFDLVIMNGRVMDPQTGRNPIIE